MAILEHLDLEGVSVAHRDGIPGSTEAPLNLRVLAPINPFY